MQNTAGSIFDNEENSIRNHLAAEIINNVLEITKNLEDRGFMQTYKERSMILGEEILYKKNNSWYGGYALDIDNHGGLVIYTEDKQKLTLNSGEVSIKKK